MGYFQDDNSAMRVLQLGMILISGKCFKEHSLNFCWYPGLYSYRLAKHEPARGASAEPEEAAAGLETRARLSDGAVVCCPREQGDTVKGIC